MALATNRKNRTIDIPKSSPSDGGGWFQVGITGVQEELDRQEARQKEYENQVRRYWMPANVTKDIIFVDGNYNGDKDPFNIREHNFPPTYRKWKTCLRGVPGVVSCPYCQGQNQPYFIGCHTIIDMSEWSSKRDGKVHRNEITLFTPRSTTLKVLRSLAANRGNDLSGCMFKVTRSSGEAANCGDVFDFIKRVNLKDPKVLKELGLKVAPRPIDYRKALQPLSFSEASLYLTDAANSATSEDAIGY